MMRLSCTGLLRKVASRLGRDHRFGISRTELASQARLASRVGPATRRTDLVRLWTGAAAGLRIARGKRAAVGLDQWLMEGGATSGVLPQFGLGRDPIWKTNFPPLAMSVWLNHGLFHGWPFKVADWM